MDSNLTTMIKKTAKKIKKGVHIKVKHSVQHDLKDRRCIEMEGQRHEIARTELNKVIN